MRALGKVVAIVGLLGGVLGVAWTLLSPGATRDADFDVRKEKSEPSAEVVASGQCVVPMCTDVDLGDRYLRYYAADIVRKPTTYIPKGACGCEKIQVVQLRNSTVPMSILNPPGHNGAQLGVWIAPTKCAAAVQSARASRETAYERFVRLRDEYEPVPEFRWRSDSFDGFEVFRSRQAYAHGHRKYVFVPKSNSISFGGETQSVAFETANNISDPATVEDEEKFEESLHVGTDVRISECVEARDLFPASNSSPSNIWKSKLEDSVALIVTTRLFLKGEAQ